MSDTTHNHQGYPILQVRVLNIRHNRMVVSLPDKRKGYIVRREWTWERSIRKTEIPQFKEGGIEQAVLLPPKNKETIPYLSIREKTDPWKDVHYSQGQMLAGEVINMRYSAVYVQLSPGIVGILRAEEMPLLPGEYPKDVLSLGDILLVEILSVDSAARRIELSALKPLQRAMSSEQLSAELYHAFEGSLRLMQERTQSLLSGSPVKAMRERIDVAPLVRLKRILVIDNEQKEGEGVCGLLQRRLQAETVWVDTEKKALDALSQQEANFDLAVIDVNLSNGETGVHVARKVVSIAPALPILFMSNDPLSESQILSLENDTHRRFPFAMKDWRTQSEVSNPILKSISDLREGRIFKVAKYGAFQEVQQAAISEQNDTASNALQNKLSSILRELSTEAQLDHCLLLRLDSDQKEVSLGAFYPPQNENMYLRSMDGLYYSPVREVIEDGDINYMANIGEADGPALSENFFQGLYFHSSYGLPVKMFGRTSEYALFVLDKRPDLSWNTISRIRLAAAYCGLTLEKERFFAGLRPVQDLALRGELMSSFLHELNNMLTPLFELMEDGALLTQEGRKDELWSLIEKTTPDIVKIKHLTAAYGRLANDEMELTDLNVLVEKVVDQLAPYAMRLQIQLEADTKSIPQVAAIALHAEQVLTNVLLNAIQNLAEQNERFEQINERTGVSEYRRLQEHLLVKISTCASPQQNACCIVVTDSGPGIPYHARERIFQMGYSTRNGGHGLGLFISRQLMEAMHGRLEWVDSRRYWGSAFAIIFSTQSNHYHGGI
ncbi:MAG: S1 RNA-binding domain-containing protein [Saprospiraceae bacterium]|nr:S1 RNA-binding domain-containing protein [Saprospiraceae bacterium]